jgi:hypothetical protein
MTQNVNVVANNFRRHSTFFIVGILLFAIIVKNLLVVGSASHFNLKSFRIPS